MAKHFSFDLFLFGVSHQTQPVRSIIPWLYYIWFGLIMATGVEIIDVPNYVSQEAIDTNEVVSNGKQSRVKKRQRSRVK